jgi:putative glutamate/gamma-aminobutyrate antiporter
MLNLSVMTSLRNLTTIAEYGASSAFYYFIVAIFFLIPTALISAELSTGWSEEGGIYLWVKEAFGPSWGFLAVWLQWIHNATWFPAILSFAASTIAYLWNPSLANDPYFLFFVVLGGFWGLTILNYLGLETSAWFSTLGVILGTIIPGVLLIGLGSLWYFSGNSLQISLNFESFFPKVNGINDLVFVTGLFLAFGGLEVSAAHAGEVKKPQRTFPKAIMIAGAISLVLYVLGALSIAIMIPKSEMNLISGLMQAFSRFFNDLNLSWAIIPIGICIILGAIGELNAWIIGPVKALHATAKHGELPPLLQKLNKKKVPFRLLLLQAVIVSMTSLIFLFMPTSSGAFWMLTAMSAQLYLLMYILMFFAAIKLRYSHPHVVRPYMIPYRMKGIWWIATTGIISSTVAFFVAFIPPSQIKIHSGASYVATLGCCIVAVCLISFLISKYRHPDWKNSGSD